MRALFFMPSFSGGGAERSMALVAKGLARRGHEVEVVAARRGGPVRAELDGELSVTEIGARRVRHAVLPLGRHLRARRPDVIVATMDHGSLGAIGACWLSLQSIPVIAIFQSDIVASVAEGGPWIRRRRPLVARWIVRASRASVAVSMSVGDLLRGLAPDAAHRVSVIPNPVVRDELFELAEENVDDAWLLDDRPLVLSVGRLAPPKAVDDLLGAFSCVKAGTGARLMIVGDGPDRCRLEALRDDLGLHEAVRFTGFRANPYVYMRHCDVFVLSSRREGLGNVLIEAGALGANLVATDCPSGPREILLNRKRSHLVPVGDVPRMADAIIDALGEPRSEPSPEGWERFSMEAVVDAYEDLLARVADRRPYSVVDP